MDNKDRMKRWRLILGEESKKDFEDLSGNTLSLSDEDAMMGQALSAIYNRNNRFMGGNTGQGGGKGPSAPQVSRWLGDVRTLFDKDLVKIVQADAMERCGLKQLVFEPEILENLEPDINLANTIMLLKEQIPSKSKENVREFMKKIVDKINKLLESDIKRAVSSVLNKKRHSPIPLAAALDFKTTVRRGIKNYNKEIGNIIPEKYYFFDRSVNSPASKYTVILDVDQSGSMGESVIYSSVISCILASMSALKTRIVAFDTEIVDLSEKTEDPVDLLFGFQLGGGTDINKSVAYCQKYIENPKKTIFFLISDLMEGGNRAGLMRRLEEMKESGISVICLLAIADAGKPYYDSAMAGRIAAAGIPCFACTPERLPELLEKALKANDLTGFSHEFK